MNCTELRDRFDAYVAGTPLRCGVGGARIASGRLRRLSRGAGRSRPGARRTQQLPRSITAARRSLARHRDVSSRRDGASRPVALPGWLLAAAAVLLIAVSSGGTLLLLRQTPTTAPPVRPSNNLTALESQYSAASADLTDALEKARSRLSPETVATIERSLRIIDEALAESRAALARDPGNEALEQLVVAAWRQKVDLLRRAMAIGKAG